MTAHDENDDALGFPAPIAELSSLYPKRSDDHYHALVAGIMTAAAPELARRRSERGLVRSILRWSRPVSVAAAAVLLVGAIGLVATSDAEARAATPSFAEVVDREPASTLLAADRPPSASDLERALDPDSFQQGLP